MARRCLVAPQNWIDGATVTATSEHVSHPATNLFLDQPRERYQALSGVTDVQIDATRTTELELTCAALLYANVHNEHASWRLRVAHIGEIATPWYDSAKLFYQNASPHMYVLRLTASGSRVDFMTTFDMTGSWLLEAVIRVRVAGAQQILFRQNTVSDPPTWYLDASRRLHFLQGATHIQTVEALGDYELAHVGVGFSDSAGELRLYINGTRVLTQGSVSGPLGGSSAVAAEIDAPGVDFADFRGWTSARDDASILADAFEPIADQAGLGTYLKLDEGTGTALADTHAGGPGATQTDCLWVWPERFWAAPDLDDFERTHSMWWHQLGGMAGHVRIDVRDELGDESAISIGNLLLSAARQPDVNLLQGSAPFGVSDFGSHSTAPNGVSHSAPGASVDTRPLVFMSRSHDEMYQVWHRFLFGLGNSKPLLFCSDPTDIYYRFQRMIYGKLDGPIIPTESNGPIYRLRMQMRAWT